MNMRRMVQLKMIMMRKQSIIASWYLTKMYSFLFLRALSHRYGDDEEKEKTIMPRLTSDQYVFFSLPSRPQPSLWWWWGKRENNYALADIWPGCILFSLFALSTLNQSLSLKLALKRVEYLAQITSPHKVGAQFTSKMPNKMIFSEIFLKNNSHGKKKWDEGYVQLKKIACISDLWWRYWDISNISKDNGIAVFLLFRATLMRLRMSECNTSFKSP